jgi:hypothetical protein
LRRRAGDALLITSWCGLAQRCYTLPLTIAVIETALIVSVMVATRQWRNPPRSSASSAGS